MNTLTTAQVLRHMADNLDKDLNPGVGLQAAWPGEWRSLGGASIPEIVAATKDGGGRLAPKTITYTVKDQPEPLRVAPKDGTQVWTVCTSGASDFKWWRGSDWQIDALERGNIFATREDAQAADAARLAAYQKEIK